MKFILALAICFQLYTLGLCQIHNIDSSSLAHLSSIKSAAAAAVKVVKDNIAPLTTVLNSDCVEPPNICPNINVTFWLYTEDKPDSTELSVGPQLANSLKKAKPNAPWKIIIHGYTKDKTKIPNPMLRSAYFKKGSHNIISVDYSPLAEDKCYLAAVGNVPLVANCTAQLIDNIVQEKGFKMLDLHVIGFSLGAQIAGQLTDYLKSGKPGRVTGLDPASPLFDGLINRQINQESGDFVDIIHTNALGRGLLLPCGHVDFYVNGGSIQPGCFTNNNGSFSTCNHDRAPKYFAESINSEKGFWGIPCDGYLEFLSSKCDTDESKLVIMGENTASTVRGLYYLQTKDKEPYALGKVSGVIKVYNESQSAL